MEFNEQFEALAVRLFHGGWVHSSELEPILAACGCTVADLFRRCQEMERNK